jgi:CHAT domain-containing protein
MPAEAGTQNFSRSFFMKQTIAKLVGIFFILCGLALNNFSQGYPETLFALAERLSEQSSAEAQIKAIENYEQAARFFNEVGDKLGVAKCKYNIGAILHKFGKSGEAKIAAEAALKISREISDKLWEGKSFNLLGLIYANLGDYKNAINFFNNALTIFKEIDDFDEAIPTINSIGKIAEKFGDYKQALFFYNLPLPYLEQTQNDEAIAFTLDNIGSVYWKQNEFQKAVEVNERALNTYRKLGNKSREGNALNNLGTVYTSLGEHQKAIDYLNQALPLSKYSANKRTEIVILSNLMSAWKDANNRETAIFYGKQAVNEYQELRKFAEGFESQTQQTYLKSISATYRLLADLLIELGRFSEAEQVLQMLKEEEFSDFIKRDANEIKNLSQRVTLNEKERELIKRYTELADKVAEIGQEFLKLDDKKRANQTLSTEEQTRYNQLSAQTKDANDSFKLFVEKDLSKELGATAAKTITLDRGLQEKLRARGDGTVALYTVVTEDRYRVILTTPTIQVDGKTEIKADELNKKVFAFLDALQNKNVDPRFLGKEIYDILLKPIERELKASNAKTLVWSLDGVLRYIPLAALSPDGETYLIEQYQNVLLTSKTREDAPNSAEGWLALGMGVSEEQSVFYPDSPNQKIVLSSLPAVKNELSAIIQNENNPTEKGIFRGRRFLDKEFTLNNLETSLASKNPNGRKKFNVVHFASHFRLGGNWSESFLLLGGGKILTLETLSSSPALNFDEVELITLSACKTGITTEPDGKEFESLAGAIQAKGGRTVLATLWDVVDESTSSLMSNFYRIKKENPHLTKAEALQLAQKMMINGDGQTPRIKPSRNGFTLDKNRPYSHPYYWSPFVIFGNWR